MLYSYQCNKCKHEFEELCEIDERNNQPCPECKSTDVDRPYTQNIGHGSTWRPVVVEHLHSEPRLYTSREQLKKDCRKLGVSCGLVD